MKTFSNIKDLQSEIRANKSIGFVPTMGALHEGHLSLISRSQKENDVTVVSIFLNSTQFNKKEDLEKYPTSLDADIEALQAAEVDILFLPDFETIYPDNYRYRVMEDQLSHELCGKSRPGHFDGVLTVVLKLFNIIKPTRAYFGEKDYQQLLLIKGMVTAFFLDIEVVSCPIVRDSNGLALSSRNKRLSLEGLKKAGEFAKTLACSRNLIKTKKELLEKNIEIDYLEEWDNRHFAAVEIENIRLIDNVKK